MGAGHGHSHGHGHGAGAHRSRLLVVLAITAAVVVVQILGGVLSGSLALLADAGHAFTDAAGLLIAVLAVTFAALPATSQRTFGYLRLEILAAVFNATLLAVVAVFVLIEAARRWSDPPEVAGGTMLAFALVGLVANAVGLLLLSRGAKESLNVRGAYLEVLGDLLGSAAVIVAAVVLLTTGYARADAIASAAVALMIVPRVWSLLREAIDVLLEATPRGVDVAHVRDHILATPGVLDVHDLHVWTITSGLPVMSAHIVVEPGRSTTDCADTPGCESSILDTLRDCLAEHFDVEHSTFQLEPAGHRAHEDAVHH
ncbi:cation diffusion facilitator family transporter [Motilibacter deserti]|uniref:Cation transporter n=1 Tax=Motilibacter deserti TaxID=2714956 RepID=A0ABX0H407_9ACTN|nr:cation diffusion facilitator family transporter [Motilibacter deserti]NHC16487.1 cation transporter [Motilibacter deserti]